MKKQSKWLLVGSLMCVGLGSVFQSSYGMFNDEEIIEDIEVDNFRQPVLVDKEEKELFLPEDAIFHIMTFLTPRDILKLGETCKGFQKISNKECLWEQKAVEAGASEDELKKVKKKFFTYQQIIEGHEYWDKFNEVKYSEDVTNEKQLEFLMQAAANGNEEAIDRLLNAYRCGRFGLQENDQKSLELVQKYVGQGSEKAIEHLLFAYLFSWYGLKANHSEGLALARKHAENGSEEAIEHFLNAYQCGWYGLQANKPEAIRLAEYYAAKGSQVAKDFIKDNG